MAPSFSRIAPILRIFSVEKAREFYLDYLGCHLDFEHRFEPTLPLYMQVSRGTLVLHLSEHHGDSTPGSAVFIETTGLDALHKELTAKNYNYLRPDIHEEDWGARVMSLVDPFGNKLRFAEMKKKDTISPVLLFAYTFSPVPLF